MKIRITGTITLLVKPKEEADKAIRKVMEGIINNPNKNYKIENVQYSDPYPVKDDFYSVYSKFEVEGNFEDVIGAILDFGIENIEVIEPEKLEISAGELQSVLNDISGVINSLDAKIKYYSAQYEMLKMKLNNKT